MSFLYSRVVRPLLFRMEAERAHHLTLEACSLGGRCAPLRRLLTAKFAYSHPDLVQTVAGIEFRNPVGLAAGFDKNGHAIRLLGSLGFGHLEIGSVSAHPSSGNPRPRLFRIPRDESIVVNYGVPNDGADRVARRLERTRCAVPLGINLVKTNDSRPPASDEAVIEDYAASFAVLQAHGRYVAINMSCPNSANDRNFFDDLTQVDALLRRLASLAPQRPVFLKLKPTADRGKLSELVAIADRYPFVAGFSINLPSGKPPELRFATSQDTLKRMPGAVSGHPVEAMINANLRLLYGCIGARSRYRLMAAGGVYTAEDAYRKIRLGASLVQLYTAMVYRGPGIVGAILKGLSQRLEKDGFKSVADAVGADA